MAAMKTSLHSTQHHLCYHFAVHPTNESCSQGYLRTLMTIRSLEIPCWQVKVPLKRNFLFHKYVVHVFLSQIAYPFS